MSHNSNKINKMRCVVKDARVFSFWIYFNCDFKFFISNAAVYSFPVYVIHTFDHRAAFDINFRSN